MLAAVVVGLVEEPPCSRSEGLSISRKGAVTVADKLFAPGVQEMKMT